MYAYIDRKKKLPVTTLLRAIGFESDKDILEIFNLAEEVKVTKTNLKKYVGRKLAARVLKTWVEDFVDEDTGEVVSIERNDVVIDREAELSEDSIQENPAYRRRSALSALFSAQAKGPPSLCPSTGRREIGRASCRERV